MSRLLIPEGYIPETWYLLSGQYNHAPMRGLTAEAPKHLASSESTAVGKLPHKDVPVRRTNSADELMAAVMSAASTTMSGDFVGGSK